MTSPIPPLLGQHLPGRVQARLLNRSYLRMQRSAGQRERVLTTSTGDLFQAGPDSFPEWNQWVCGSLEVQLAHLFSCLVQPGGRCVVVGTGIGLHAVRLAKLTGPAGEVIAIEPDPETARRAARNIALNGLANVRIIPAVASDASGPADPDLTGPSAPAPAVAIDVACAGPVALMEIDAGGRAAAVVDGAAATIDRDRPAIVFGYAPELLGRRGQRLFGHLAEAAYLLYQVSSSRKRLTGRGSIRLDPLYAQPGTSGRLLAVSESDAPRIISLVASRDGRI
jgi:FkbM family methyltransferase